MQTQSCSAGLMHTYDPLTLSDLHVSKAHPTTGVRGADGVRAQAAVLVLRRSHARVSALAAQTALVPPLRLKRATMVCNRSWKLAVLDSSVCMQACPMRGLRGLPGERAPVHVGRGCKQVTELALVRAVRPVLGFRI